MLGTAAPTTGQIVAPARYDRVDGFDPFLGNGEMPGRTTEGEIRVINRQINRARRNGWISRREARQLRAQAAGVAYLAGIYRQAGLSRSERLELRARTDVLRDALNRRPPDQARSRPGADKIIDQR
jgi:hypothetical protein